jgi:hypothetical protein
MPAGEEVVNDYRFLELSLRAHPATFLRVDLTPLLARLTEDTLPIEALAGAAPASLPPLLASDLDVPARGSAHAPSRRGGMKITRR